MVVTRNWVFRKGIPSQHGRKNSGVGIIGNLHRFMSIVEGGDLFWGGICLGFTLQSTFGCTFRVPQRYQKLQRTGEQSETNPDMT